MNGFEERKDRGGEGGLEKGERLGFFKGNKKCKGVGKKKKIKVEGKKAPEGRKN